MPATPPRPEHLVGLRHLTWALLALLLSFFGWLTGSVAYLLAPRRGRLAARVGTLWGRSVLVAGGGRLVVEGTEHIDGREARMLVANHASSLDPPAMLAAFPTNVRVVMKKELGKVPFLGWYAKLARHLLLDRERARSGKDLLSKALERGRDNHEQFLVFPEGTRSDDGTLQPLRAGAFQLAIEGGFPVQPVAILGTHAILPKHSWGPRRGGRVTMRIGPPISTGGLRGSHGRKLLAEQVQEALLTLGVPAGA